MKKRICSFAMALLMILSMLSTAVFAADTVSITVGTATVEPGKTATVDVSIAGASSAALMAAYFDVDFDSALTLSSVTLSEAAIQAGFTFGQNNLNEGIVQIDGASSGSNINDGVFFTMEFAADVTASGTYSVSIKCLDDSEENVNDGNDAVPCTFTAGTITVGTSGGNTANSYTASLAADSSNPSPVRVGDTIKVDLGVNAAFAATEMTITYVSSLVSFDKDNSTLGTATITDNGAGTIELADYGADKSASASNYVLAFKANSDGDAAFAVTVAAFGTGTSAETANLTEAGLPSDDVTITIEKAQHSVTLNQYNGVAIFAGATSVEDGATYTFTPETATGAYYDYTLTTVTMNGVDVLSSVTGDATNGWSIANVTGDLEITGTRTAKSYNVTIYTVFGEETTTATGTATYGNKYEFVVPDDVPAGENVGYTYELTSVTVNGNTYTGYSVADGTRNYTIPGTDVTGAVEITITKTEQPANTFNVDISGDGAGQVSANPTQVTAGNSTTLTLTPDAGYTYVVKVNGQEVTLDSNNQYTITNVQSADDVKVTVDKSLTMTYASVSNYLQVDGSRFWLVKIAPTNPESDTSAKISGKTYTYGGEDNKMFWSDEYNAYCWLVVAESEPVLVATDFAIVSVDAISTVDYGGNVNMADESTVDAADAQLVWNMYTVKYSAFSVDVTMEKFLRADVNSDGIVDVNDATAIINSVLNITT